jgi:hypothetical protein
LGILIPWGEADGSEKLHGPGAGRGERSVAFLENVADALRLQKAERPPTLPDHWTKKLAQCGLGHKSLSLFSKSLGTQG